MDKDANIGQHDAELDSGFESALTESVGGISASPPAFQLQTSGAPVQLAGGKGKGKSKDPRIPSQEERRALLNPGRMPAADAKIGDFRRAIIPRLREKINSVTVDTGKMERSARIHQSSLYTGTNLAPQAPAQMPPDRKIVRHLATAFLALDPRQTEVQAAVSNANQTIHWANNTNSAVVTYSGMTLSAIVAAIQGAVNIDEVFPAGTRQRRHWDQLSGSELGTYGAYTVTRTTDGIAGQHAETRIINEVGAENIDYIGGTRRPCMACYVYMALRGVDPAKFNSHHGAYWDAQNAIKSLAEWLWADFQDKRSYKVFEGQDTTTLIDFILAGLNWNGVGKLITENFYASKSTLSDTGAATRHTHDIDTDSEAESDDEEPAVAVAGLGDVDMAGNGSESAS